ncbi:MAG: hypothetical protein O8C60_02460, partial [Candidatus Methanoperedens sp.]|nr:hypothetical protein [Candidatus Methanoperedens sp.]
IIVAAGAFIYLQKAREGKNIEEVPEPASDTITGADLMDLEERIIKLLKESGGSMHQSDIG